VSANLARRFPTQKTPAQKTAGETRERTVRGGTRSRGAHGVWRHLTCAVVLLVGVATPGAPEPALAAEGAPSASEPFGAANSQWDGHSEWVELARGVLGPTRVELRATLDYSQLRPADAVILFHPENPLRADSLARFMNAGGRVAVFDDFGKGDTLWRRFSIRDTPGPIGALRTLLDNSALPIAEPHISPGPSEGRHPMVSSADQVVTNHPIVLEHPGLTALLEFATRQGPRTLALTGVIEGRGRLVVCGDSSVFLNLMLRYPGNRAFAEGVVRYLLERDEANSSGRLYVLSGAFDQVGDYGHRSFEEEVREQIDATLTHLQAAFKTGFPLWMCSALGLVLVLALAFRARSQGSLNRVHIVHGFAESGPRLPNPGSRVELLSAKTTTPLLALAELSIALEGLLGERIGRTGPLSNRELELALTSFPPEDREPLRKLRAELAEYKRELARTRRKIPSKRELEDVYGRATLAIDSLDRLRKNPISNPQATR
jgi:hypothetical protein